MNKKLNKKGFTLVELLAVIVVLALILILAVPSVLNTMTNAQKTTFQMYGQKIINAGMQIYESERVLGSSNLSTSKKSGGNPCYTISDIVTDGATGSYEGFLVVEPTSSFSATYKLYLKDDDFIYNGVDSKDVLSGNATIGDTKTSSTFNATCQ